MRATAVALGCLAALAATAAIAVAGAKPGGAYSGQTDRNQAGVTFGVSANGEKVKGIRMIYLPTFCSGGTPVRNVKFKNADIRNDKFTASGKEFDPDGNVIAHATMTGKFLSRKKEQGELTVHYTNLPGCSGTTKYSTKLVQFPG
jgi:hypothetical protein